MAPTWFPRAPGRTVMREVSKLKQPCLVLTLLSLSWRCKALTMDSTCEFNRERGLGGRGRGRGGGGGGEGGGAGGGEGQGEQTSKAVETERELEFEVSTHLSETSIPSESAAWD